MLPNITQLRTQNCMLNNPQIHLIFRLKNCFYEQGNMTYQHYGDKCLPFDFEWLQKWHLANLQGNDWVVFWLKSLNSSDKTC